jgi:hypothetical protein
MSLKMIYTVIETVTEDEIDNLGKIIIFDKYTPPSPFFPYFYLSEKSETLNHENWPDLVEYLYDRKLGFFATISNLYQYINYFGISSFVYSQTDKILTLRFTQNPLNQTLLKAIQEDRDLYYFENGTYSGWNRTITPIIDLKYNNNFVLYKDNNYYIQSVNYLTYNLNISINLNIGNVTQLNLTNQNFEFGLYRIPNKTRFQSVYYHGLNGKTFCNADNFDLIPGLRTRSQIMGHTHEHVHNMTHTHTMPHTHDLNNHSHGMIHTHGYYDSTNSSISNVNILDGNSSSQNLTNQSILGTKTTGEYAGLTDPPNNNITQSYNANSSSPNNNITSGILSRTTNKDDNHTTDINFKVGNKTISGSYTVFPYISAKRYRPTT